MTEIKKILIIRFSAIGDIIWTSVAVRCLKIRFPNAEIHFVTKCKYYDLVAANPHITKVHTLDNSIFSLLRKLRAERYDIVIDLHKNLRSHIIKFGLFVKSYTYQKLNFRRFLFTRFGFKVMPNFHVVDRYVAAMAPLGVVNDEKGLDFFISAKDKVETSAVLPESHQHGYTAIVIGASQFTKLLPYGQLKALCVAVNEPIVLVGGPEDAITGENLQSEIPNVVSLAGKLSLAQSASVLQQASRVVGHDTGLTHIAAAFHEKVYGIYGGTSSVGYYPYCAKPQILERNDLQCHPCSRSGTKECPQKHFACLSQYTVVNFEKFLQD